MARALARPAVVAVALRPTFNVVCLSLDDQDDVSCRTFGTFDLRRSRFGIYGGDFGMEGMTAGSLHTPLRVCICYIRVVSSFVGSA